MGEMALDLDKMINLDMSRERCDDEIKAWRRVIVAGDIPNDYYYILDLIKNELTVDIEEDDDSEFRITLGKIAGTHLDTNYIVSYIRGFRKGVVWGTRSKEY